MKARNITRTAVAALAMLVAAHLQAAPGSTDDLQAALSAKAAKDADGILWKDSKHVSIGSDGRTRTRIEQTQRLITAYALDAWADPVFLFDSEHQDLTVEKARTMRPDGQQTESTPNAINVLTPSGLASAPWFADVQETSVTLLGLEKGAVSEVAVVIEDREPFKGLAWGVEPLHDGRQITHKEIAIKLQGDRKLVWTVTGMELKPEVIEAGSSTTWKFKLHDLSATSQHETAGPDAGGIPSLLWMEDRSEQEMAGMWLASAPYAGADTQAGDAAADAILDVLRREAEGKPWTAQDRALAWWRRIVDGIALVQVDRSVMGMRVRDPWQAFSSGYADRIEKLGILHTVAARMGWNPQPIVVLASVPAGAIRLHPANVEQLWVRIEVEGRIFYLDTASSGGTGEPKGKHVFMLERAGLAKATGLTPASTRLGIEVFVDLGNKTPACSGTIVMRGESNPYFRIMSSGKADALAETEAIMGNGTGLEITSASFTRLAIDETVLKFSALPLVVDGIMDLALPSHMAARLVSDWEPWMTEHDFPIEIQGKETEKVRFEIALPEGASVLHVPHFETTSSENGPVEVFHSVGLDPSNVSLARRVTLAQGSIAPSEIDAARAMLADAFAPAHNRIVIQLP